MNQHFCVQTDDVGVELDEYLCRIFPLLKKRDLRAAVREGLVTVNGGPAAPGQRLRTDDVVSCEFADDEIERPAPAAPSEPPVLLYEDEHVLAIDKPADLLVEPDRWDEERPHLLGGLSALSEAREREGGEAFRPRLVHRLDRDTSGCMVIAKTVDAERALGEAFEHGTVRKRYLALVEGEHELGDGEVETLDLPIGPDGKRSGQMCVRRDGKPSRTEISVVQRFRGFTLLACSPLTGRTHQIRVHLSAQGFPLAVDPLYGRRRAMLLSEFKPGYRRKPGQGETPLIARLSLHAESLEFPRVGAASDPGAEQRVRVSAPPPKDFERVLKQLAKWRPARR